MFIRLSFILSLSAAVFTSAGPALAQTSVVGSATQAAFINLGEPSVARGAASTALVSKAAALGQVRVIAELRTPVAPEHDLTRLQASAQAQRLALAQAGVASRAGVAARDVVTFESIPFVSMWVNAAQLRRLLADPNVVTIQEDRPGTAGITLSVPRVGAATLWNIGVTGAGYAIAVLDTGVDKTHPMFAGKIISEACFSTRNAGQGITPLCPGGVTQTVAVNSGRNCLATLGQCFHGTHVAGIAAGVYTASNPDRIGVARGSRLIAIQVFSRQGNNTITFDTDWIKGLQRVYALRNTFKIASVNMSLGFGEFSGPCDQQNPAAASIIRLLRLAKIATVVAAMNDSFNNKLRAPACITAAITVGSTLRASDAISNFSNHHPQIHHMAPGSDIMSAVPGNQWRAVSGTSMAAPHVAGAYALLRQVRPTSTVDDIVAAMECTGVPVTRAGITERRINLIQARAYLINPPRTARNYTFVTAEQGWLAHAGGWAFVTGNPGYLHINEASAGYKVASAPNCNEAVDITSKMIRLGPDTGGLVGVIFKSQFAGSRMSGYLAAYSRTGQALLRRLDNYDLATDQGAFRNLCTGSAAVQANNFNTLKVVTRGFSHTFFVNGTRVCTASDFTYATGRAGVFTFMNQASTQNGFAVDQFLIRPVETVPPAPSSLPGQGEQLVSAE